MTLYTLTLAPTVMLEQSGAFVVAGQHLGVGRVPGYPVWHLLAKLFISLFWFVRYHGYPNPAWATNFMSAFFGSLSCGLVALIVSRVGRTLRSPSPSKTQAAHAAIVAVAAGTQFAVSRAMWSQSLITETHTLTLFFFMMFLVTTQIWLKWGSQRMANLVAAVFGIGLAQSYFFFLLIPSYILAMFLVDKAMLRDFTLTILPVLAALVIFLQQSMPDPWVGMAVVSGVILSLALSLRFLPQGRTVARMILLILAGLSLYAYLPLAGEGHPPMYFAYPRTWEGFRHCITRGQYAAIVPTNVFGDPLVFLDQLNGYVTMLCHQFMFPFVVAGLIPIIRVSLFQGSWRAWWAVCILSFFMFSVVLIIGLNPSWDVQSAFTYRVLFIPSFAVWSIFIGLGVLTVLEWLKNISDGKTKETQPAGPDDVA
ncbi:MAG: DUF2723 domain-containing protein [Lentisphaerae bacterium]|nr:DUF2723 domain-containing protein [Lentisphaerota bacterium]